MTKTLHQIIFFFPPPKSEYFFQQHWESEYLFRKKTIPPPFQVKWSFPNEYHNIFARKPSEVGRTGVVKHSINTGIEGPIK